MPLIVSPPVADGIAGILSARRVGMGKIINVEFRRDRTKQLTAPGDAAEDRFMIEEGLDLLHDFRSIRDPQTRRTLATLVHDIAAIAEDIATRRPKVS